MAMRERWCGGQADVCSAGEAGPPSSTVMVGLEARFQRRQIVAALGDGDDTAMAMRVGSVAQRSSSGTA